MSIIIVCYQNVVAWRQYGVFKHNEYYDLGSGDFKIMAFMKTFVFSTVIYSVCVFIVMSEIFKKVQGNGDGQ